MVSSLTQENFFHLKENVCDINAIAAQMSYVRCKQVILSKQKQARSEEGFLSPYNSEETFSSKTTCLMSLPLHLGTKNCLGVC